MDSCKCLRKNGVEVELQRNMPREKEEDHNLDFDSSNESDTGDKDQDSSRAIINFPKIGKLRVRHSRTLSCIKASSKPVNRGMHQGAQSIRRAPQLGVDLAKLGTDTLRRYCKHYTLMSVDSNTPREEMLSAVQRHFSLDLNLNEAEVIVKFVQATRTLASG